MKVRMLSALLLRSPPSKTVPALASLAMGTPSRLMSVRQYAKGPRQHDNASASASAAAAAAGDSRNSLHDLRTKKDNDSKQGNGNSSGGSAGDSGGENDAGASHAGPDAGGASRQKARRDSDLAGLGRGLSLISSILLSKSTDSVAQSSAYYAVKHAAKAARDAAVQHSGSTGASAEQEAADAAAAAKVMQDYKEGLKQAAGEEDEPAAASRDGSREGTTTAGTGTTTTTPTTPKLEPQEAPPSASASADLEKKSQLPQTPSKSTQPQPAAPEPEPATLPPPPPPRIEISPEAKARAVPSSRFARVWEFGSLGVGLGMGALSELGRRAVGSTNAAPGTGSAFLTQENTERVVATLCRVRGAALKIGQMVSIQDSSFLPQEFQQIFDRVRDNADFMPTDQMLKQMDQQLGDGWRDVLLEFEEQPFAAASIGQVHRAVLADGRHVAVKIQYPGVADSIDSDINNLLGVLNMTGLVPKGLYVERVLETAKKELKWECDYEREADCSERFAELVADTPMLNVPQVIREASSSRVLTTELVQGMTLEKVQECDQETRNRVASEMMRVTLRELFEFRFMQTDPNWSNFLYDDARGQLNLLDFGATIEYEKEFIDNYIEVIHAASTGDEEKCLHWSVKTGFLSGGERTIMQRAHVRAVMALGKPFMTDEEFDFGEQDVIEEVKSIIPIMLKYREKSPPTETYSLHRKLSGAFLLCARLNAKISCGPMFRDVYEKYPREESHPEV